MKTRIIILSVMVILILSTVLCYKILKNKIETYTITFDSDGGSIVDEIKVKDGEKITLPTPTKDGYIFEGWYNGKERATKNTRYKSNTRLKAHWVEAFKITFDSKGGSNVEPLTVECGKTLKLPRNPTKEGYTFGHWIDKWETPILEDALLSCEDITLYAVWE